MLILFYKNTDRRLPRVMLKTVYLILYWILIVTEGRLLDDYIQHYEELHYSTDSLHRSHLRAKRSVTNPNLNLKFKAFGRDFDLQLERAKSIFTSDHKLRHNNGSTEEVDTFFIYEGKLRGIKDSFVHGAVIEGVFRGFVDVPGDTTYHIEHSRRFFGKGHPVHSIIYSEKHLNLDPYKHKRKDGIGTCGVDLHEEWLTQHSKPDTSRKSASEQAKHQHYNIYTRDQQTVHSQEQIRHKRATLGTRNTCYMYMRSDPILHNHLMESGVTNLVAKDEILALFSAHIAAINKIYGSTNFQTYTGQKSYKGVQFQVQRTTIMTDRTENCDNIQASAFCNPNIDVSNFLNLNSLTNHDEFCLAYVFTARDFTQGTLGLAWVGSSKNAAGGICEKWKDFPEGSTKVFKSLNTGIVTIVNYGKQVAPRVSHLTFAHECGHNFGSPHDSGPKCAPYNTNYPGSSDGNYIMYASATQGDLAHNSEFSDCSKDNISRVLYEVTDHKGSKNNCFKESGVQFCGNGLVEGDEECDCGFEEDCTDICCNPKKSGSSSADECKLKFKPGTSTKYECSPTQGPCCTNKCGFIPAALNTMCRVGTECVKAASCSGNNATCPEPDNYPDINTFCNDKTLVCENGMCTGSLCKRVGYKENNNKSLYDECFKSVANSDLKEGLCYLSCKKKSSNDSCMSSADGNKIPDKYFSNMLTNISATGTIDKVKLPAGSPCNNYKGYCDVFHRCRGIDNDGPLARLKNLIFNEETLTNIINFLSEYWWGVMLCCIGLIIFMAVFIKVCAVHTPSSNPKAKPALKITDTLRRRRRPQQQSNQQQPLQQYSNQQYPPADYDDPYSRNRSPTLGFYDDGPSRYGSKGYNKPPSYSDTRQKPLHRDMRQPNYWQHDYRRDSYDGRFGNQDDRYQRSDGYLDRFGRRY